MSPHTFLLIFAIAYQLWVGKTTLDRIGKEEQWSNLSLDEIYRLAFHDFSATMFLLAFYAVH